MHTIDIALIEELYRVASSLLWDQKAAEAAVLATCSSGQSLKDREKVFGELVKQVRRRRRWTFRPWVGIRKNKHEPALCFLRNMSSLNTEHLVLADVCGFDCEAISRILNSPEPECRAKLSVARQDFQAAMQPRPRAVAVSALRG